MKSHKIVWLNGPYKGSVHDLTIARDKVTKKMNNNEKALADKGYIGEEKFCCPIKRRNLTPQEMAFNTMHYQVRQSIERLNGRIKGFKCFQSPWRNRNYHLHKVAFFVVVGLIQLDMPFHPLTQD